MIPLQVIVGGVLVVGAFAAAVVFEYPRFYLPFVAGMFLCLKAFHKLARPETGKTMTGREFFLLYFWLGVGGVLLDGIVGRWLADLWIYPAYTTMDFVVLYSATYPLAGMVMVYSFLLAEALLVDSETRQRVRKTTASERPLIVGGLMGGGAYFFLHETKAAGFVLTFSVVLLALSLACRTSRRHREGNLLGSFAARPILYPSLFLLVAYGQGLTHEVPNVFAGEWEYRNWPLEEYEVFGIPAMVLLVGWIALTVVPYSLYEVIVIPKS